MQLGAYFYHALTHIGYACTHFGNLRLPLFQCQWLSLAISFDYRYVFH
jgi:hypothetical protein